MLAGKIRKKLTPHNIHIINRVNGLIFNWLWHCPHLGLVGVRRQIEMTLYEKTGLFPEILAFYQAPVPHPFHRTVCLHHLTKMDGSPITITQLSSLLTGHGLKRDYVNKKQMSVNAKLAVIASEDQLFPDHNGFDFKSIEKAMKHNQKSKSMHGASTISQQTAKMFFMAGPELAQKKGWKCISLYDRKDMG